MLTRCLAFPSAIALHAFCATHRPIGRSTILQTERQRKTNQDVRESRLEVDGCPSGPSESFWYVLSPSSVLFPLRPSHPIYPLRTGPQFVRFVSSPHFITLPQCCIVLQPSGVIPYRFPMCSAARYPRISDWCGPYSMRHAHLRPQRSYYHPLQRADCAQTPHRL